MLKLATIAAASGLMLSTALAQTSPPATSSPTSPSATTNMNQTPPAGAQMTPAPATRADTVATSNQPISAQKPDQMLASKFKGTDVLGPDDQKVGDINDILFAKDGKVEAYVVSVGGFLGMGAKEIALPPGSFQVVAGKDNDPNDMKLKISMTKDELQSAANFEKYDPPRTTTGTGGTVSRPAGAGAPAR
jgi:hypothetical protein